MRSRITGNEHRKRSENKLHKRVPIKIFYKITQSETCKRFRRTNVFSLEVLPVRLKPINSPATYEAITPNYVPKLNPLKRLHCYKQAFLSYERRFILPMSTAR